MDMSFNNILIEYGPYEVDGVIKHRTRRLEKLIEKLLEFKFMVKIRKIREYDRLILSMVNTAIFQCQYSLLRYADTKKHDPLLENCLKFACNARSLIEQHFQLNQQINDIKDISEQFVDDLLDSL